MGTRTRRAAVGVAAAALMVTTPVAARPLMTKSDAVSLAKAVNLTADDVPAGFVPSGSSNPRGQDLWGGKRFARCSGRTGYGRALADVDTGAFEHITDSAYDAIGSEVEVMPNAALAKKDIAVVNSKRGRKCLLAELRATQPAGVGFVGARTKLLSPGIPGGIAMRITLIAETQGVRFPFYTDLFVIRQRNVEAAVIFLSSPNTQARADEDKYVNIVQTRLNAALNPNTIL
jgi:hypothetical protein